MTLERELPLPDDHQNTALCALFTMGVMLFPNDNDLCGRWAQSLTAVSLMEEFESSSVVSDKGPSRRIWKLLKNSRHIDVMRDAAQKAARRGFTAGRVLTVALMLGAHLPRFASINKAVRIVMREQHRSKSAVMEDWGDFKSVAHLWAAQRAFQSMADDAISRFMGVAMDDLTTGDLPESEIERIVADVRREVRNDDLFQWWQDDNFHVVLSIAEAFRLAGEVCKASGAREPLLRRGEAFMCPPALGVKPGSLSLPEPAGWMVQEIASI